MVGESRRKRKPYETKQYESVARVLSGRTVEAGLTNMGKKKKHNNNKNDEKNPLKSPAKKDGTS